MSARHAIRQHGDVAPTYQFRLTKYDPALRDATGVFTGDDWTLFSQIGETFDGEVLTLARYLDVEARHLNVLASFLEESGTSCVVAQGVENAGGSFRVSEGAKLTPLEVIEAVRQMLREDGWCRLVDDDRFYINVGWDYYVYVGTDRRCDASVALAEKLGLFIDRNFPSPYMREDDG